MNILVHSYKGGSGKTLISTNLADLLSAREKKVLLVETDFTGPAFQSIFTEAAPDVFLNDFLISGDTDLSTYIYHDENFDIIFCNDKFQASDPIHGSNQNWFTKKKVQIEKSLDKLTYDAIIFDSSPGFSLFTVNILAIADHVILVNRLDQQSQKGLDLVISNIYKKAILLSKSKKFDFHVVINQTPNIEIMQPVYDKFRGSLEYTFDFIDNIFNIQYDNMTNYHTSIDKFILPFDDPTKIKIDKIASTILGD